MGADMTRSPAGGAKPRRRRLLLLSAVIIVAVLGIGYIGMTLLGSPADSTSRGTVEFGTGGSGCSVDGTASSFPSGTASIYEVAHFAREVRVGEVVTFRVLQDGAEIASVPRTFDATGDCLGGALPSGLPPGQYRIEYLAGAERLAAGEFEITP
jgi:hypothetical protein